MYLAAVKLKRIIIDPPKPEKDKNGMCFSARHTGRVVDSMTVSRMLGQLGERALRLVELGVRGGRKRERERERERGGGEEEREREREREGGGGGEEREREREREREKSENRCNSEKASHRAKACKT